MATKKMTVAQALIYKKRVIETLTNVSESIRTYNSVPKYTGEEAPNRDGVDIAKLLEQRTKLKMHLVNLKTLLWEVSANIRKDILWIAEWKDDAKFWASVPTKNGFVKEPYSPEVTSYDAVIRKAEIDSKVTVVKKAIDSLQSVIERFNHSTMVEIEDVGV